jgi:Fic family protein
MNNNNNNKKRLQKETKNILQQQQQQHQHNNKCSNQLYTLFLIILFSILINIIYFHFIYKPNIQSQQKQQKMRIKNYDHIVFPSLIDHNRNNQNLEDEQQQQSETTINQIDYDSSSKQDQDNKKHESKMAINLALQMQNEGKLDKAAKIYKYALSLDPDNIEALTFYGEYLELHKKDIIKAEHFYTRAFNKDSSNNKAIINLKRTLPLVNKLDRLLLNSVDLLLEKFYQIPVQSSALKRAKKEAYFMHIYHTNAIEGNTLNLKQTRLIVENRMSISGKSLIEHQEVLGIDAALRYINETLLYRPIGELTIKDILDIHRRVLGFCDPIESGKFRQHQVYVGDFIPPHAHLINELMNEFIDWLNEIQLLQDQNENEIHPIQIAALAHYKFVFIHPFYDGNGRTGRLLMNLILMKYGYPPVIIRKEERLQYYDYLEQANQGDVKPFIRFIAKCTQRTLKEYIHLCTNSTGIEMINKYLILNTNKNSNNNNMIIIYQNSCKNYNNNFNDFINQLFYSLNS